MSPDLIAGRYELIERIAGGGMGQVWRGRDRVLERIVAVKTVDLTAQEPTARERFRREAIATAGLSAPNIVQVYDAGVDDTTAYLVMELLTGPTLSQIIHDGGPMRIDDGIHVALEVARALQTAHRIGIVHRDIKPGNVMYHHDQVKLLDFGIAQLARNLGAALTAPATALGTAAYMSPEQATGEGATEKSDWYAMGCLLMTMFTGQPPFSGDPLAVANQQINTAPPQVAARRPEVPPALDRLVAGLLAKDPAQRPSGDQVVEQLRQLAGDPNAGTVLMSPDDAPTAAWGIGATSVMGAGTAAMSDAGHRISYGETPHSAGSPGGPAGGRAPVAPVAPPPPLQYQSPQQRRPVGLIITVIVLALAVALGAAYLLLNQDVPTGPVVATPTATPTPSVTRPTTTTAAPTRTTQPATTQPATTAPPTTAPPTTLVPTFTQEPTSAPATTTPPDSGDGGSEEPAPGEEDNNTGEEGQDWPLEWTQE